MVRQFVKMRDGYAIDTLAVHGDVANAPVPEGWTEVSAAVDVTSARGRAFDPATGTIGAAAPVAAIATSRIVTRDVFLDRITIDEEATLRLKAEDPEVLAMTRALIASFTARIYARERVDLDDPRMAEGLALCKAVGVWPDAATADARIAEILA